MTRLKGSAPETSLAPSLLAQLADSDSTEHIAPALVHDIQRLAGELASEDHVCAQLGVLLRDATESAHPLSPSLVRGLLIAVEAHRAAERGIAFEAEPHVRGMTEGQYLELIDYVERHLSSSLTLADLAAASALTVAQCSRALKRTTGKTPMQWLQERRIDRAKDMLVKNEASLDDIATACGFSDQSHLTDVFIKLTGTSPDVWRRSRCGTGR